MVMEAPQRARHGETTGSARRRGGTTRAAKRRRQHHILDLVTHQRVRSQQELVELLSDVNVHVTQATVSRDITELGLIKVASNGSHVYTAPSDLPLGPAAADDDRLRRVLADYSITIGRSGLTLLLISEAGTAGAIAQAIDESSLREQEGTLAGDNTILVLFRDEERLESWRTRFEELLPIDAAAGVTP